MVYYDVIRKSPLGQIMVVATRRGLSAVRIGNWATLSSLAGGFPDEEFERAPERLAPYQKQIEEYFAGDRTRFSIPVDLELLKSSFRRDVLRQCQKIPYGTTLSYGELAARVGSPRAARAVGAAMAANPVPIVIPCHRVVASNNRLGGFALGPSAKEKLLSLEGVALKR